MLVPEKYETGAGEQKTGISDASEGGGKTGESGVSRKPGMTRKRRLFLISIVVFTILIVYTAFDLYNTFLRPPASSAEAEKIRDETVQKIEAAQGIPYDENAWFVFEKAREEFDRNFANLPEAVVVKYNALAAREAGPADVSVIGKVRKSSGRTLDLADEAYEKLQCCYPLEYKKGILVRPTDKALEFMGFARFLTVVGDSYRLQGKDEEAVKRYFQALYLASGILRNACEYRASYGSFAEDYALPGLCRLINASDRPAEFYRKIVEELERLEKTRLSPADIYRVQTVLWECSYDILESRGYRTMGQFEKDELGGAICDSYPVLLIRRDRWLLRNWYVARLHALEGPLKDAKAKIDAIPLDSTASIAHHLTRQTASDFGVTIRARCEFSGTKILAALKWYRQQTGKYPDRLQELVPEYLAVLPQDPYSDDGSFVYRKDGDAVFFYSIGADGRDDGGKKVSTDVSKDGDLVFAPLPVPSDRKEPVKQGSGKK